MASWSVYLLRDPRDLAVRYCGWSTNPERRFRHHLNRSCREHNHKASWVQSLLGLGLVPVLEIVEVGDEPKGFVEAEQRWIRNLRISGADLTNLTDGGEGCVGLKHSPESIERSAAAHRGLVFSAEVRQKVSAAGRGRKHSPETLAKMREFYTPEERKRLSDKLVGIPKSQETRSKMSVAATRWQTGRKLSPETRAKMSASHKKRHALESSRS